MGQGFSLATPSAVAAGIDVSELSDLVYEKSIGNGRFMKSVRARCHEGLLLVKVLVKPYTVNLDQYKREIIRQRKALADVPNAQAFQRVIETDTNGYLVRQYLYSSLYDRLSTRPFLEDIEKKWLAFQLLSALRDCHARDIYHGDIKAQNVLVTSWNWLYLSDFSSAFKPVMLPDDLPADFSYYFDSSGRRTCYIAPERFLSAGIAAPERARLTWAMDVFSAGCVIAQMFLESEIFNLAQVLSYRQGKFDPVITHLSLIADRDLRDMVAHMIQLDPEKRYSAEHYLQFWRGKVFPDYFYSFLHQYMELITDPSSGNGPVSGQGRNLGEPDDRIDRVFHDFDKISYFLGHHNDKREPVPKSLYPRLGLGHFPVRLGIPNHDYVVSAGLDPPEDDGTVIFLGVIMSAVRNTARSGAKVRACDVLLALAERLTDEARLDRVLPYMLTLLEDECEVVVVTAIRSIGQLLRLVRIVTPINSHVFADYILPRMEAMLRKSRQYGDPQRGSLTRATYASCLGGLAMTAQQFMEVAQGLRADGSFASTDAEMELAGAGTAAVAAAVEGLAWVGDRAQSQLLDAFENQVKALVEDTDPHVRRAFLTSVPELCVFFAAKSNEVVVSLLNTYLNDRDWTLKCAFFEASVGIAAFLGSVSVEEFILPLMVQALADAEEWVVREVLHSLAQLAQLGLLSRTKLWELLEQVSPLSMHPNGWIREAAVELASSLTRFLSAADVRCLVLPILRPYLKPGVIPADFSELALLGAIKRPLTRTVFDQAVLWALRTDKGVFWKSLQQLRVYALRRTPLVASTRDVESALGKSGRNDEDEQWLVRLRNLGLGPDDELKLVGLREFIWRVSLARTRDAGLMDEAAGKGKNLAQDVVRLKSLKITPQTVLIYQDVVPAREQDRDRSSQMEPRDRQEHQPRSGGSASASGSLSKTDSGSGLVAGSGDAAAAAAGSGMVPYTIADALLDASRTIDEPSSKRNRASVNSPSPFSRGSASPRASTAMERFPSNDRPGRSNSRLAPRHDDSEGLTLHTSRRTIRHRSSALSLMDRKDSSHTRALAETSTTEATAFGEVEGPLGISSAATATVAAAATAAGASAEQTDDGDLPCREVQIPPRNSYEGHDPSIIRMLNSIHLGSYAHEAAVFGPLVTPASRRTWPAGTTNGLRPSTRTGARNGAGSGAGALEPEAWRPRGVLVATFAEHTGAVNRVVPSADHVFFITGGDDGTVRVWDTARLERNMAHRSRQVHRHGPGIRVTALCFIDRTHSFVSCGSDGSVHVVFVDVALAQSPDGATRYGRLRLLREHGLDDDEHAVWAEHFFGATAGSASGSGSGSSSSSNPSSLIPPSATTSAATGASCSVGSAGSVLILATNRSRVLGLDPRTMTTLFSLNNPLHHGAPTCFCLDRRRYWLCLGTAHGVLDLWDLRFAIRVRAWGLPGAGPVHRLGLHPSRGRGKWVVAASGGAGDVTVWDLERAQCREAYRNTFAPISSSGPVTAAAFAGWDVDAAEAAHPEAVLTRLAVDRADRDGGVCALAVGTGSAGVSSTVADDPADVRAPFFVTAGTDRKLRFWDLARPDLSVVFSGLAPDEPRPAFSTTHPSASLTVTTERPPRAVSTTAAASRRRSTNTTTNTISSTASSSGTAANATASSRSTVISVQHQQQMRAHLDAVLDLALLELPYPMCVSVDRLGVVFVFR